MDEQIKTTEEKIIESAVEIFAEKGYNGTTTKEIAQKAGVAEGTIFRYFPKKKDLLHGILLKTIEKIGPRIIGAGLKEIFENKKNHSDKELIIAFIENRLEVVSRHLSLVKVILNEAQYHEDIRNVYFQKVIPPIKESIDRFFEEGTKRGRFRDIDPGAMTMALIGCTAVNALARLTKVFGEDFHYEEKLEETVDIFMNGIANK